MSARVCHQREVVDEESGQAYYYNSDTGESSWDKPAAMININVVENTSAGGGGLAGGAATRPRSEPLSRPRRT